MPGALVIGKKGCRWHHHPIARTDTHALTPQTHGSQVRLAGADSPQVWWLSARPSRGGGRVQTTHYRDSFGGTATQLREPLRRGWGELHKDRAPGWDLEDEKEPVGSTGKISEWPPQYYWVILTLHFLVIYLRCKYNSIFIC